MTISHVEALHWLLNATAPMADAGAFHCREFISKAEPCELSRDPDDLVLRMFIQAGSKNWHLNVNEKITEQRKLFSEYIAAGYIKVNEPLARSTASTVFGGASNPLRDVYPLELAMRHSSVAVIVALLEEGANESLPRFPGVSGDFLQAALLIPGNPDVMVAAVTSALMQRQIASQGSPVSAPGLPLRRRSMVV